jgi:hypothetical protein
VVGLLAYLTLTGKSAAAAETETAGEASLAASTGMRQFYLTIQEYDGDEPLTACAPGYHFASLWELADPSNLKYNTSLGFTKADSGEGPPSHDPLEGHGWVRTGYASDTANTSGHANCAAWTTDDGGGQYGTLASLDSTWASVDGIGVWLVGPVSCNTSESVWCIED